MHVDKDSTGVRVKKMNTISAQALLSETITTL